MKGDSDLWWILTGGVNSFSELCPRCCSIDVIQFVAKDPIKDSLELGLSVDLESAKENGANLADLLLNRVEMFMYPLNKPQLFCRVNEKWDSLLRGKPRKLDIILSFQNCLPVLSNSKSSISY